MCFGNSHLFAYLAFSVDNSAGNEKQGWSRIWVCWLWLKWLTFRGSPAPNGHSWILFQGGSVSFLSGSRSTHHKPLDYDKAGLVVGISEAVLAGDQSRVTQIHLNTLVHSQLHLGPRWKTHMHINQFMLSAGTLSWSVVPYYSWTIQTHVSVSNSAWKRHLTVTTFFLTSI